MPVIMMMMMMMMMFVPVYIYILRVHYILTLTTLSQTPTALNFSKILYLRNQKDIALYTSLGIIYKGKVTTTEMN